MNSVSRQTKLIQNGMKDLRAEVDNPIKVLDIGQEAIILSGLNKQAGDSLKNIKNLYDETKYLKSYLEKVMNNISGIIVEIIYYGDTTSNKIDIVALHWCTATDP